MNNLTSLIFHFNTPLLQHFKIIIKTQYTFITFCGNLGLPNEHFIFFLFSHNLIAIYYQFNNY